MNPQNPSASQNASASESSATSQDQPRRSATINTIASQAISTRISAVTRRATSFMERAREPPPAAPKRLKQRNYPVYELPWEKLKDWLENKFPELKGTFKERRVCFLQFISPATSIPRY